jgi:hypothetical protein
MTDSAADPSPQGRSSSPLVNLGGMIGIAGSLIGLAIFMAGCFGFMRAFDLAILPLAASAIGLVLTVVGGVSRTGGVERTGVVASLFVNVFALVGGLLLYAMLNGSTIFPSGGQ